MAHVTFIHGIGRKPTADALLGIWRRSLAGGPGGIDLGAEGVSSSMVYWADVLYPEPDPDVAAHESSNEYEALASDVEDVGEGISLQRAEDAEWLARLGGKLLLQEAMTDAMQEAPPPPRPGGADERFPVPWVLKQKFLAAFLRDVHHYLFDVEHEPRPGERYRVRQEIRRRFVAALKEAAAAGRPQVVVSHSMGTVVAYDCLKNVPDCPPVDALVTLGSPLGLDEVQDRLAPGWSRADGFPHGKVAGGWVNVFDRLDVVAALDPELADDFRKGGVDTVVDVDEPNYGKWRHTLRKYFEGAKLRAQVRRLLEL
jgi:hypothetical protein